MYAMSRPVICVTFIFGGLQQAQFFSGGCPLVCSYRLTDSDQVPPANQGGLVPL